MMVAVWIDFRMPVLVFARKISTRCRFTLEPTAPAIDLGDVLVGEEASCQIKLTNTVAFALQ
jgi:hypothetical protein